MDKINPLTREQITSIQDALLAHRERPQERKEDIYVARFLANGQAIDITNGNLAAKYSNIIYHPLYYGWPKNTICLVAQMLSENNPGIVIKVTYHGHYHQQHASKSS